MCTYFTVSPNHLSPAISPGTVLQKQLTYAIKFIICVIFIMLNLFSSYQEKNPSGESHRVTPEGRANPPPLLTEPPSRPS